MYNSTINNEDRDIKVHNPDWHPLDTVQCICWDRNENSNRFLVGGWDGILRCYSVAGSQLDQEIAINLEDPVLSCAMDLSYIVYTGHTDGTIKVTELASRRTLVLGKLPAPVKDLYWCDPIQSLIAVTIDTQLTFWRSDAVGHPVFTVQLPYKTVVSAFDYPYLLLGTAEEKMCVARVDNPQAMNVNRYFDSSLGVHCKLLSADINAQTKSWIFGSVDGRGNYGNFVETISGVDCSNSIVCFKAQRREDYSKQIYLHVNSCGIVPRKP